MQNNMDAALTTQKLSEESKFNRLVQICRVSERKAGAHGRYFHMHSAYGAHSYAARWLTDT